MVHPTIVADVLDVPDDDVLWYATETNARHGFQLSREDKKNLARVFFGQGKSLDAIARVLSVSERMVDNWTEDLRREAKERQQQQVLELYLACKTHQEITDIMGLPRRTVTDWVDSLGEKRKNAISAQPPESLQTFNVWNFNKPDPRYGLEYPGRIPGQIYENLLWYYTEPFDLVVDPMGGGGTIVDVCKVMYRRYQAYDIHPVRDDIRMHDVTQEFPKDAQGASLIVMDPPYWKQKRGDYSDDGTRCGLTRSSACRSARPA